MADPRPQLTRASNSNTGAYAMHIPPYGIDRGTCDRNLLSRDLAVDPARLAASKSPVGGADSSLVSTAALGRAMDAIDQACIGRVLEYAPDRTAIRWYGAPRAAYGGPAYAVTPLRTFERDGQYCREYQAVGTIDGQTEQSYGTACRMSDGIWRTPG